MADDNPLAYVTRGFDQYGSGGREVAVDHDEHHVTLSVEATSGSTTGDALLTPGQARMVAAWLIAHARLADELSEGPDA